MTAKNNYAFYDVFLIQEYMPFRDVFISAFKNDIEYSNVLLQTAAALQTNKFMQVGFCSAGHNEIWVGFPYCIFLYLNQQGCYCLEQCLQLMRLATTLWLTW